jgi:Brp/Blh family beta-carotene 15,15'-monooxygenase
VGIAAILAGLRHRGAAVELGAYALVALTVPPHIAFAVYFCALHSPRHFRETTEDLDLSTREAVGAALPYALPVGVAGAVAAAWLAGGGAGASDALAPVIFVGLACLTVPHMMLEMIVERPTLRARIARTIGDQEDASAASTRSGVAGASRW